jgi:hypothetical protein
MFRKRRKRMELVWIQTKCSVSDPVNDRQAIVPVIPIG